MYRHVFSFNPDDNSGESLTLVTNFHFQDNKSYQYSQSLDLQSYGNSASFCLCGAQLTPENLRKLANELDKACIQAQEILKNEKRI